MESEESILSCAVVIANQAHRILNSTEDWTALPQNDTSISVEKKSITGKPMLPIQPYLDFCNYGTNKGAI